MKNSGVLLICIIMIVTGCSLVYDFYPAKLSHSAKQYVNYDPNYEGFGTIAKAKELKEDVTTKRALMQVQLKSLIDKDNVLYARAIEETTLNLTMAESERAKVIGTIEQPGWLLGVLLPIMGGLGGRFLTTLTHYSEQELKAEIAKVTNGNQANGKTNTSATT